MTVIDLSEHPVLRGAVKVILRTGILLAATILISVIYKCLIELELIELINGVAMRRVVFCLFELLLLGVYWHYTRVFSAICYSRTRSVGVYYLRTGIVFIAFSTVYGLSYLFLSREMFLWVFRITVNLIGVRFLTYAPDNLLPYMAAYLAVMFFIMFWEPVAARLSMGTWNIHEDVE